MARKTATIVIEENNRDAGRQFIVTEMSAVDGSRLAFQVFQLMATAGLDINLKSLEKDEIIRVIMGAISSLHPSQFDEYRQTLLGCVQWQNPTNLKATRKLMDSDIEEISTILRLMFESLKVNLGDFFTEILRIFPGLTQ